MFGRLNLEPKLEKLKIKYSEDAYGSCQLLDHPAIILKIVLKELGQLFGIGENVVGI